MGVTVRRGHRKSAPAQHPLHCILAGWDALYQYTADLLTLEFCRPACVHSFPELMRVSTLLRPEAWGAALAAHPDRAFADYVCRGLREGFRTGFDRRHPLRSTTRNMPSTELHPEHITEYLAKELERGRMIGPLPLSWRPHLHINRFGLIPKGHNTGKFRLITDLSFPKGASVNDGIDPELATLSYITVDHVAEVVQRLGEGALLAKMDVEAAYRLIPVHPQDRVLQGMEWKGAVYIDPQLPFGLRSAPKIFNAVADALCWCLQQAGIRSVHHYLDDYIIVAPPASNECLQSVQILGQVCSALGVPMAPNKQEGPTTCLVFLGIQIDTVAGELRLPEDKLQRLQALLQKWGARRACQRRELESLVGLLNHACKVVRPGRSFLRRLLDLLHGTEGRPQGNSWIRLSQSCQADIAWWAEFVGSWNGVSFLRPTHSLPEREVTSDASGAWGCGAWHGSAWFQLPLDERAANLSIAAKELVPIVLACAAWGRDWQACRVRCRCDNQVVVAALGSRSSRDPGVMHLLRCLVFVEAQLSCHLVGDYIDTHANHLADDLSRNRLLSFLSKVPWADKHPSPFPGELLDLLLDPNANWVSPLWRRRFSATFNQGWQPPPTGHTGQQ